MLKQRAMFREIVNLRGKSVDAEELARILADKVGDAFVGNLSTIKFDYNDKGYQFILNRTAYNDLVQVDVSFRDTYNWEFAEIHFNISDTEEEMRDFYEDLKEEGVDIDVDEEIRKNREQGLERYHFDYFVEVIPTSGKEFLHADGLGFNEDIYKDSIDEIVEELPNVAKSVVYGLFEI